MSRRDEGLTSRRRATRVVAALGGLALTAGALATTGPASAATSDDPPPVPKEAQEAKDAGRSVGGDALGRGGLVYTGGSGVPAPPAYPAGGYVLADVDTGDVLVAKSPHAQALPASTMKTLTALAVVPRVPAETVFTAQPEDANVDGTKVGIDPGVRYTTGQCTLALLMSSANDCAVALARVNGGLAKTTNEMNTLARSLGALDTTARNTSGLDAAAQVTSAYDLALIGRAAVRDPDVAPYLTVKTAKFPGGRTKQGQKRTVYEITSHNRLLWNYAGTLGVKNGYTVRARHTNIAVVRRGRKSYVFAFLNGASNGWRENAKMFDWAFAHGPKVAPVGRLVDPATSQEDEEGAGGSDSPVAAAGQRAGAVSQQAAQRLGVDPRLLAGGVAALVLLGGAAALRARARRR